MSISIEDLKRKIIYRSTYRGSKEMDTILTAFTKMYINKFNEKELKYLSKLLDLDDENLYKFNQGMDLTIEIKTNKVTKLFQDYDYKSE